MSDRDIEPPGAQTPSPDVPSRPVSGKARQGIWLEVAMFVVSFGVVAVICFLLRVVSGWSGIAYGILLPALAVGVLLLWQFIRKRKYSFAVAMSLGVAASYFLISGLCGPIWGK